MKIRLLRSLPIEVNHGCQAGTVWEVEMVITGKHPRYLFMSEAGKAVVAMNDEAEVVVKLPKPEAISYEDYYCQPEGFVPKPDAEEPVVEEDEDEDEPFKPLFGKANPGRKPRIN